MFKVSFHPFPKLRTQRLTLRQLQLKDDEAILALHADAHNRRFIDKKPMEAIEQSRDFIDKINNGVTNNEWIYWAITLNGVDELIGTICLWNLNLEIASADLGYELSPLHQKRGYMNEALQRVLQYADQVAFRRLEAYTHAENSASINLLEQNQFVYSKTIQEFYHTLNRNVPMAVYIRGWMK